MFTNLLFHQDGQSRYDHLNSNIDHWDFTVDKAIIFVTHNWERSWIIQAIQKLAILNLQRIKEKLRW